MYRRSFLALPQAGICADSFLFPVEEELQRRTAGGEQQQQPRATRFDVSAALRFTVCRHGHRIFDVIFAAVDAAWCDSRLSFRAYCSTIVHVVVLS